MSETSVILVLPVTEKLEPFRQALEVYLHGQGLMSRNYSVQFVPIMGGIRVPKRSLH